MPPAPPRFTRRARLLAAFLLSLAAANCSSMIVPPLGTVPKLSINLIDDAGQPLDSVQVIVSRHAPSTLVSTCGDSDTIVPGDIATAPPQLVDKHFDYQCPWGSEWIQIEFHKPGYLPASRDFGISHENTLSTRVFLHKLP